MSHRLISYAVPFICISSSTYGQNTPSVVSNVEDARHLARVTQGSGVVWFVDDDATGTKDGSSWCDAFINLQDALVVAQTGDMVRVAQGIYKPDQGGGQPRGDRTATFQLFEGITLRGGYAGCGQPDPNMRDIDYYLTILSGDLAGDDGPDFLNNAENSYNVVSAGGVGRSTVVDGFTITGGNVFGPPPGGGGMFLQDASPTVIDTHFIANTAGGNSGGAMYADSSSPLLLRCSFIQNTGHNGGALWITNGALLLTECTFSSNTAINVGGAIFSESSSAIITACLFLRNSSGWWSGGAIFNSFESSLSVTNSTFVLNTTDYQGGAIMDTDNNGVNQFVGCRFVQNRA